MGRQELTFTLKAGRVRLAHRARRGPSASPAKSRPCAPAASPAGGSLHNAVVLDDTGIISGPLRFRDEFVRHKVMDLIGDLALLGRPLTGHIHARKAGHALHIEFARALDAASEESRRGVAGVRGRRSARLRDELNVESFSVRVSPGRSHASTSTLDAQLSSSSFVSRTCSAENFSSLR